MRYCIGIVNHFILPMLYYRIQCNGVWHCYPKASFRSAEVCKTIWRSIDGCWASESADLLNVHTQYINT